MEGGETAPVESHTGGGWEGDKRDSLLLESTAAFKKKVCKKEAGRGLGEKGFSRPTRNAIAHHLLGRAADQKKTERVDKKNQTQQIKKRGLKNTLPLVNGSSGVVENGCQTTKCRDKNKKELSKREGVAGGGGKFIMSTKAKQT